MSKILETQQSKWEDVNCEIDEFYHFAIAYIEWFTLTVKNRSYISLWYYRLKKLYHRF
jgi:hypothetical protein